MLISPKTSAAERGFDVNVIPVNGGIGRCNMQFI